LRLQLKKTKDGRPSLACVRDDGTRTWARLHPFFPVHDLTHCAVESVLGFDRGFFGLVASGWEIDAFTEKGISARLPAQVHWAESIVALLDLERAEGTISAAADLNARLAERLGGQGVPPFRPIADAELVAIRHLRDALQGRWLALRPGDTLEVGFPTTAADLGRRTGEEGP
jgi:hypothetical protein